MSHPFPFCCVQHFSLALHLFHVSAKADPGVTTTLNIGSYEQPQWITIYGGRLEEGAGIDIG